MGQNTYLNLLIIRVILHGLQNFWYRVEPLHVRSGLWVLCQIVEGLNSLLHHLLILWESSESQNFTTKWSEIP